MNDDTPASDITLYIAGPMRHIPKLNWPAFEKAADLLRAKGFGVVSPVEMSEEAGISWDVEITTNLLQQVISADTQAIIWRCDAIALLDGWHLSGGCKLEVELAGFLSMRCRPLKWWLLMYPKNPDAAARVRNKVTWALGPSDG